MDNVVLVDTNFFLRYFLQDNKEQSRVASEIIEKASNGRLKLWVSPWTIGELIWVLSSVYEKPKSFVLDVIEKIFATLGVVVGSKGLIAEAFRLYKSANVDFEDAMVALEAKDVNITSYLSFDKHFQRFPWLKPLKLES